MKRPYMKLRIGDLTDIADDPGTSEDVRNLLVEELRRRSSPGAKRLLLRLEGGAARADRGGAQESVRTEQKSRGVKTETGAAPSVEVAPHVVEREATLAALRETYTEGAEVLARWGLTTAIPAELFDVVVAWWGDVVTDVPDRLGRSKFALADDVATVRSLGYFGGGGAGDD